MASRRQNPAPPSVAKLREMIRAHEEDGMQHAREAQRLRRELGAIQDRKRALKGKKP